MKIKLSLDVQKEVPDTSKTKNNRFYQEDLADKILDYINLADSSSLNKTQIQGNKRYTEYLLCLYKKLCKCKIEYFNPELKSAFSELKEFCTKINRNKTDPNLPDLDISEII